MQAQADEAIGELDARHVRLLGEERQLEPTAGELAEPDFSRLLDKALDEIDQAARLREDRLARLNADLGEMANDPAIEATRGVLRSLLRLRSVAVIRERETSG